MSDNPTSGSSGPPLAISRRHFVIGGALAVTSGVAYARQPKVVSGPVDGKKFESWVPNTVGAWRMVSSSGVVLPPPDAMSDRLYDNLVTRVYAADGLPPVMLLIAYNNEQDGVLQLHRPEICYPVGGYKLSPTQISPLIIDGVKVPGSEFTATGVERTEQVLYYTRLGKDFPVSWVEQRTSVFKANLEGEIPDGLLVRFSLVGMEAAEARTMLTRFADKFVDVSPAPLRKILVGPAQSNNS